MKIPITSIHRAYLKGHLGRGRLETLLVEYQKINPEWKADDLQKLRQFFNKTKMLPPARAASNMVQIQEEYGISNTCIKKLQHIHKKEMITWD
jgi:hypothetical protein|tara:strand:- start:271 stop:549 length:279 start_codon:yes stop_codon:yes gene_type:complete